MIGINTWVKQKAQLPSLVINTFGEIDIMYEILQQKHPTQSLQDLIHICESES